MITPLTMEILQHYYCIAGDFPRLAAPACIETVEWLIAEDVLERTNYIAPNGLHDQSRYTLDHRKEFRITPKGHAWFSAMLTVPMPKSVTTWEVKWDELCTRNHDD